MSSYRLMSIIPDPAPRENPAVGSIASPDKPPAGFVNAILCRKHQWGSLARLVERLF